MLAEARRFAIAELLRSAGAVSVAEVERRFGVSPMTARRDLRALEEQGIARRIHGGAVLPSISAQEDSFTRRLSVATAAKARLADAAVELVAPEETIVLDSSSSAYFVAQRLVDRGMPVTVITNSLPIMRLIASIDSPPIDLIAIGGTLRRATGSFVGPAAVEMIRGRFADRMFLSAKGLTTTGVLTDADELEAECKRAMIAQAAAIPLVDGSKLGARGRHAIAQVGELACVLADGLAPTQLAELRAAGATVRTADGEATATAS